MALTREQAIQQYGTEAYTAWGEVEAAADARAKGIVAKTTPTVTPTVTPKTPTITPTTPTVTPTATTGQMGSVQDLINAGYGGYVGWGETEALADFKATGGHGQKTGGGTTGAISFGAQPTINLMEQQQKLYEASGIDKLNLQVTSIQTDIDTKKAEADKRRSEVNENPFLSESSRVGRISKIDQALNDTLATDQARLTNAQNEVISKRNEINEKLGIQVQQYNIDLASKQSSFNMLNSLLSSGALTNATPADLTNLAAQAGVPMSFIQSAIKASQKADVQITTETDNAGNVTILTIDKNTGQIVSQVGAGKIGKGEKATGGTTATKEEEKQQNMQTMIGDIKNGVTLRELVGYYGTWGGIDTTTIYRLYNQYSSWGRATETLAEVKAEIFKDY